MIIVDIPSGRWLGRITRSHITLAEVDGQASRKDLRFSMTRIVKSSPNTMVMEYFSLLHQIAHTNSVGSEKRDICRTATLSIILAVTVVETFINVYFRLLVSGQPYSVHESQILDDLNRRVSLERKLLSWPKLLFKKTFDETSEIGRNFKQLRELRNRLMHFTTSHETVQVGNMALTGVSDISFYDNLTLESAHEATITANRAITEILRLSGIAEEHLAGHMIRWTGEPPS